MKIRTPAESAAMQSRLRAGIYAGKTPEEMAPLLGTKPSYVYTLLRRRLGFEKMLVDEDERRILSARRQMILNPKRRPK